MGDLIQFTPRANPNRPEAANLVLIEPMAFNALLDKTPLVDTRNMEVEMPCDVGPGDVA
jgi:hypothetical protein